MVSGAGTGREKKKRPDTTPASQREPGAQTRTPSTLNKTHNKNPLSGPTTESSYHIRAFWLVTSYGDIKNRDYVVCKRRNIPNVYAGENGVKMTKRRFQSMATG